MPNNTAYQNQYFRIAHCDDCAVPGHLVVFPQEDILSLSDMPPIVAHHLGATLTIAHKAVQDCIKPQRIYTLSFSEILPTIHFHIFPRTRELLTAYNQEHGIEVDVANGALMFNWARDKYKNRADRNYLEMVEKINSFFLPSPGAAVAREEGR